DHVEAIICSMTLEERMRPKLLNGTRRARIARGSGTSVEQVNALARQYETMRKMMKQLKSGGLLGRLAGRMMPGGGKQSAQAKEAALASLQGQGRLAPVGRSPKAEKERKDRRKLEKKRRKAN